MAGAISAVGKVLPIIPGVVNTVGKIGGAIWNGVKGIFGGGKKKESQPRQDSMVDRGRDLYNQGRETFDYGRRQFEGMRGSFGGAIDSFRRGDYGGAFNQAREGFGRMRDTAEGFYGRGQDMYQRGQEMFNQGRGIYNGMRQGLMGGISDMRRQMRGGFGGPLYR